MKCIECEKFYNLSQKRDGVSEQELNFEEVAQWLEEYQKLTSHKSKTQLQNLIAIACIPLVKKIARNLARRSTDPVEDIIQVGSVGLLKAIRLYNSQISKNFKTYATYLITGEIRHYLRDKASMIKAPRAIQELAYRVHRMTMELAEEFGEKPTESEIADKMDLPIQRVYEAIEIDRRKQPVSLDQLSFSSDEEYSTWGDKIADLSYQNLQTVQEDRIMLADSLKNLDESLREVVDLTYFKDMNQVEIAKKLGISQMQVSRKLKKALHQLFEMIKEKEQA